VRIPLWGWAVLVAMFMAMSIGFSAWFSVYWVHRIVSNECGALTYLTSPQVHLKNVPFRDALVRWARGDGCP
jgi:hypothetical protein